MQYRAMLSKSPGILLQRTAVRHHPDWDLTIHLLDLSAARETLNSSHRHDLKDTSACFIPLNAI